MYKFIFQSAIISLLILLFGSQVAFALKPKRTYDVMPEKYSIKYEAVEIPTSDNATLKAWYFPCPKQKTNELIIISHNGEGNMADYLSRVTRFTSFGFNVLTYDYRGFGESSDFEIDEAMLIYPEFCTDFNSVIEYVKQNYVSNPYVYGWGIGGALSLGVGYHRKEVKKIIADSPFTTLSDAKKFRSSVGEQIKIPDIGFNKQYEPMYSFDVKVTTIRGFLIIVGGEDPIYNEKTYKDLRKKNSKLVEIMEIKDVDRNNTYENDKDKYIQDIVAYIKQ